MFPSSLYAIRAVPTTMKPLDLTRDWSGARLGGRAGGRSSGCHRATDAPRGVHLMDWVVRQIGTVQRARQVAGQQPNRWGLPQLALMLHGRRPARKRADELQTSAWLRPPHATSPAPLAITTRETIVLRLHTPSGSIEALPHQEARVRALSTAALLHELYGPQPDPFALAEAIDREMLAYHPLHGWHLTGAGRRH